MTKKDSTSTMRIKVDDTNLRYSLINDGSVEMKLIGKG